MHDIGVYDADPSGNLTPVRSSKTLLREHLAVKPRVVMPKVEQTRALRDKCATMKEEASVWPGTVIYRPLVDEFYEFERFTKQFAMFTRIHVDLASMKIIRIKR